MDVRQTMVFNWLSGLCIGTKHMGEENRFLLGMMIYGGVLAAVCVLIVWVIAFRMHPPRHGIKQRGRK